MARAPKPLSMYFDPVIEPADAEAVRAFSGGSASGDQQRRAWRWILQRACRMGSHCFVPGDPHGTAFLEGRRSVGVLLTNALRTDGDTVTRLADRRRAQGEQP